MNILVTILGYALSLLPSIVTGVQAIASDQASGADKAKMAKDALAIALQGANAVLPTGGVNSALATAAGAVAGQVIDATTAINQVVAHVTKPNGAMQSAYNLAKSTGALAAAKQIPAAVNQQGAINGGAAASVGQPNA